jgi:hypothetical protein
MIILFKLEYQILLEANPLSALFRHKKWRAIPLLSGLKTNSFQNI